MTDDINQQNTAESKELTLSEHRREFIFDAFGEQRPPPQSIVTHRRGVQVSGLLRKSKPQQQSSTANLRSA